MQFRHRHFTRQHAIVEIPGISWSHGLETSGNCMRNCEAIAASATGMEGVRGTGGPGCGARGRGAWLDNETTRRANQQHTRCHWCGGRRRDRRARLRCPWARGLAGLRADAPSQRLAARTARGRAAAHGHTKQPGPTEQDTRRPEHPWGHKQPSPAVAASSPARQGTHTKTSGTGRRHDPGLGRQGTQS